MPERTWIEVGSPNYFAMAGSPLPVGEVPSGQGSEGSRAHVVLANRTGNVVWSGPLDRGRTITWTAGLTVIGVELKASPAVLAMAVSRSCLPVRRRAQESGEASFESRAPRLGDHGPPATGKRLAECRAEVKSWPGSALDFPSGKRHEASAVPETAHGPTRLCRFFPSSRAFSRGWRLVLFISWPNVVNLMLSRALVRQRDLALRAAARRERFRSLACRA